MARRRADTGQGRASSSGAAIGGPRRLNTSTASRWPGRGAQATRSGAGLLSVRAAGGRSAISGVAPAWAARCRRRSVAVVQGPDCHHSTAAQPAACSACSAAQAASAARSGVTQTSRPVASPSAPSAATQGQPGGAIHSSSRGPCSRSPSARSQGASSASSPPAGGISSSVRPAGGQPPSGSSASSPDQPQDSAAIPAAPICPARHSATPAGRGMSQGKLGEHIGGT